MNHGLITVGAGTAGGTLLIILANIHSPDLVKTVILSALGAVVSFLVSCAMKHLLRKKQR
jgi:hypothetical protein